MAIYYHATFGQYLDAIKEEGLVPHMDGNDNDNWGWGSEFGDEIFLSDDADVAASYCESADAVDDEVYDTGIYIVEVFLDDDEVETDPFVSAQSSFVYHGTISPDRFLKIYPYDK